uniref:Uncharacterized protein n=1 Tax=Aegilops tauschii subsp. strangulata TaxID=200361 RepID=A0A453LD33_AEGTS
HATPTDGRRRRIPVRPAQDGVDGAAEEAGGEDQVQGDAPPAVPRRAASGAVRAVGVRGTRARQQGDKALARHLPHRRDGGASARLRLARSLRKRRLPQLRRFRLAYAARPRRWVFQLQQRAGDQGRRRRRCRGVPAADCNRCTVEVLGHGVSALRSETHDGEKDAQGSPTPSELFTSSDLLDEHWFGGMDAGSYYASLAQGMLMEPPSARTWSEDGGEYSGVYTPLSN